MTAVDAHHNFMHLNIEGNDQIQNDQTNKSSYSVSPTVLSVRLGMSVE